MYSMAVILFKVVPCPLPVLFLLLLGSINNISGLIYHISLNSQYSLDTFWINQGQLPEKSPQIFLWMLFSSFDLTKTRLTSEYIFPIKSPPLVWCQRHPSSLLCPGPSLLFFPETITSEFYDIGLIQQDYPSLL